MAAKTWTGPSAQMRKAHNDSLFAEIVRRCGRHGINFDMTHDGQGATLFTLEQARGRCGTWFKNEFGTAGGRDPWATALHIALDHTPLDAELLDQYSRYLDRELDDLSFELRGILKLEVHFEDLIASVRA